jgi:hypothetical protein
MSWLGLRWCLPRIVLLCRGLEMEDFAKEGQKAKLLKEYFFMTFERPAKYHDYGTSERHLCFPSKSRKIVIKFSI